MPKLIDEQELMQIEQHIAVQPEWIGIGTLLSALAADGVVINRRTLSRRLGILIADQRIKASGTRKGSRYSKIASLSAKRMQPDSEMYEEYIPLSSAARDILAYVRRFTDVNRSVTSEIFSCHTRQTLPVS